MRETAEQRAAFAAGLLSEIALRFGANDYGSLMMEENVVSAAGTTYKLSSAYQPGTDVKVTVQRDGKEQVLNATLAALQFLDPGARAGPRHRG